MNVKHWNKISQQFSYEIHPNSIRHQYLKCDGLHTLRRPVGVSWAGRCSGSQRVSPWCCCWSQCVGERTGTWGIQAFIWVVRRKCPFSEGAKHPSLRLLISRPVWSLIIIPVFWSWVNWHIYTVLCCGVWLCDPMDCSPPDSSVHEDSLGKNTGVNFHALLQGIFPAQESNPGLLCCTTMYNMDN